VTATLCADEHVPSVVVSTLRSSGFRVERARDVLGEGADDRELLSYCYSEGLVLITNDNKDFGGSVGRSTDHVGIIVYTNPVVLRQEPTKAVRTIERILEVYSDVDLENELVWLDQWFE
jgi:predicted nuclease of predicted toxin-antitoxin system